MMKWWKHMEKKLRNWIYGHEDRDRVGEAVSSFDHAVAGLHHAVNKIQSSPDPWFALVSAIRYGDSDYQHHDNGAPD